MELWIINNFLKGTGTLSTYGSTVVAFVFVLMPLNTSFDLIDSYGETICHKSSVKVRVVMSVFASPVANSDRSVMILYLNNLWSLTFIGYIVCAVTISNKGIFILSSVLSALAFFRLFRGLVLPLCFVLVKMVHIFS